MSFNVQVTALFNDKTPGACGTIPRWGRVPIRALARVVNGYPFDATKFNKVSGLPLIRIRDILDSSTDCLYDGDVPDGFWVDHQDLLIGMDGDFNCSLWAGGRGLLNQRVCKVIPDETAFSKRLLFYLLPAYLQTVNDHTSSVTVKHLSSRTIQDLPVPAIPRAEQDRIVAALDERLSELDASVASLERAERNLVRYRAAVLAAACSGKLVPTEADLARRAGRSYEPAGQLLARILAERRKANTKAKYEEPAQPDTSKLPKLPEGWVWATLPMLGELNRGKSKHRPRDDKQLYGGKHPFIQTGDVRHSRGSITTWTQTYSDFGLAQSRLWPIGTLCITIAANIADTGIMRMAACFPDSVVGFLPVAGINTDYIQYFIMTAKERIERYAPATAQKNINLDILEKVAVPLPPAAEQERIVAEVDRHLSRADALAASIVQSKRRTQRLRRSILAAAFQGRLVPQDPNDEPASVLLDRIRAQAATAEAATASAPRRGCPPAQPAAPAASASTPASTPAMTPKRRGRPPGSKNKAKP